MAQIIRLGCFVGALVMVVLMYVFDWFRILGAPMDITIALNYIPLRGWSGLVVILCEDCPVLDTGGIPGGLAWLGTVCALQMAAALVASGWQVLQGWRNPRVTAWAVVSAVVLGLCTLGVLATFDVPSVLMVERGFGPYAALLAATLTMVGHSPLPDLVVRGGGGGDAAPPAPPGPAPGSKVLPGSGTRIPR